MAQDLIIQVEKPTIETVEVGVTLRKMYLEMAANGTPGMLSLQLEAKDETGAWRSDIAPVIVHSADNFESDTPQERYAASMFHQLMFTALVSDTPEHQALGIVGLTVWDAAKVLLPGFLGATAP